LTEPGSNVKVAVTIANKRIARYPFVSTLSGGERVSRRKINRKETIAGYLFLAPNMVGFLVFMVFPLVGSLLLSFSHWNLIQSPTFAGLDNYRQLFENPLFWQSLKNTAYFAFVGVPLQIILGLFLAVLLYSNIKGLEFFRTVYFLPVVSSTVAVSLMWQWLFDSHTGLLNHVLGWFGINPVPWLVSPKWAMPSVILVALWKGIGYNMVIFLAALKGVPEHLYESARIDGANRWQQFWNITFPMISPSTFFVTITSIINSFQVFDVTTVLTGGGPANATHTIVMMIYQYAFDFFRMGYASSIAYVLFGIVLIFTLLQLYFSKKWVHY